ncbi:MAG: TnpV protein [Oscillospiraceae bacterium]|nr:TnpV protein [Oscillospiraceae bacterium]
MQETIYDPKTGLHYKLVGDYYIPLVKAPESPNIGIWGHHRFDYLKNNRRVLFSIMQMNETLTLHLEEVDRQATDLYDRLIKQFATAEGITEDLKATNQMEWVARMNNIHSRATEIVGNDLIFV